MDFTNLINVDVDKRTSESIKQISRSERNNSLYLERNDRIPCPAFPVSWVDLTLWAVAEFFVVFIVFQSLACWCFFVLFCFVFFNDFIAQSVLCMCFMCGVESRVRFWFWHFCSKVD